MENHLERGSKLELVSLSFRRAFSSFLKRKEIIPWTIIMPMFFSFLINIVILLRDSRLLEAPSQSILTIGVIFLSIIMLNLVIFAEMLLEDSENNTLCNFLDLIGRLIAYLIYTILAFIFLLVFGLLMGSVFDLSLSQILASIILLVMTIVASWGVGLIFSSISRNNRKLVGILVIIPIFTLIYVILISIRGNFFNRFPQIVIDLIRMNPFTAAPSSIIQLIVGDGWIGTFDPLSESFLIFTSVLPILLFLMGIILYNRYFVQDQQINDTQTTEIEHTGSDVKSGSFFNLTRSAIVTTIFLPLQYLSEALVIIILFVLPLYQDRFLNRQIVILISSIIGIFVVYLLVNKLIRIDIIKTKTLKRKESIQWTFMIFCLFWLLISLSTILLQFFSSIFGVELIILTSFELLPVDQVNNLFSIIFWLISSTVFAVVFKELWYRRTVISILERRGMSSSLAILASSFVFGILQVLQGLGLEVRLFQTELFSISTKYNTIATFFNALYLFNFAFLLSLACGVIYIITRSVIYPIIIHSLTNLIILLIYIFLLWNNQGLLFIYGIFVGLIQIFGMLIILNFFRVYFQPLPSSENWRKILPEFSSKRINRSFLGFLLIFTYFQFYLIFFQNLGIPPQIFIFFQLIFLTFIIINTRSLSKKLKTNPETQVVK